jgi:hypothetical protein
MTQVDPSRHFRARARSAQIGGPDCIAHSFQVSSYSSEPTTPSLARNLLAKYDWRAALADEAGKLGPEVTGVGGAKSFAGDAERLAWARPGPDRAILRPLCDTQSAGPSADSSEEVTLREAVEIGWGDIGN